MVCLYTAALNSDATLSLSPYITGSAHPAERVRATPKSCQSVFHSISDGSVPALLPQMRDGGN